ncbi:MAG TPA: VWA domain-containing protein [Bryobacteraceae bacterium]|nr:VWA domain-containing protein [Bryobacteraceae bacterium]
MKNQNQFSSRLCVPLTFALLAFNAAAQDGSHSEFMFKSNSELVIVPVTVTNRQGAMVNGLTQKQFQVKENKVDQRIAALTERDVPASMGIVLDVSGSMDSALPSAKTALSDFLDEANPEDEAFLYTVSSNPHRESFFTTEFDSMLSRVSFRAAYGSTALTDTIYASLDGLRAAKQGRRALVVVSDGMDNHSRYSKSELLSRALESDAQIYTISLYNPPASKKAVQLTEQRAGLDFLEELAGKTGGISFVVHDAAGLHAATAAIGHALRNEYVLSYIPQSHERNGKWRSIKVTVAVPHATVYTRSGYRAD